MWIIHIWEQVVKVRRKWDLGGLWALIGRRMYGSNFKCHEREGTYRLGDSEAHVSRGELCWGNAHTDNIVGHKEMCKDEERHK